MRRLLIILSLLLSGCLRDADPFEVDTTPLQVHAVLQAGADSVTVLLSRPARDVSSYVPVSGADVSLIVDGLPVRLAERTGGGSACVVTGRSPILGGAGCYTAALPSPVRAGAIYGLVIDADGRRVTGETRVPEAVTLLAPAPGTTVTVECVPVRVSPSCRAPFPEGPNEVRPTLAALDLEWDAPASAARIEVVFRPVLVRGNGTTYPGDRCEVEPQTLYRPVVADSDGVRWPVFAIYCLGPLDVTGWDSIDLRATVAVYDESYSDYLEAVLDRDAARADALSAGLSGALGVFGSVNAVSREITLVRVEKPGF